MNEEFVRVMSETACDMTLRMRGLRDTSAKRGMMSLLLTLCRNMEDVASRNASKDAQARAYKLGLDDLRKYHWDDGRRFPGGRKSSRLHWEHWRPAADLRRDILALETPTSEKIQCILKTARVCWILLEENVKLNELGHRINRKDPQLCYEEAQIQLCYDW